MKDIRQRLLATFQVEHKEHVQRIRETLAAVETSGGAAPGADLDEMFRRAHSLKGAARAVDLRPIEALAHRLETLFARVRDGSVRLETRVIAVIHQVLDASEDWLASSGTAQPAPEPVQALQALDAVLGTRPEAAGPIEAPVQPAAAAAAPSPPLAPLETVRLDATSLDRIVTSAGQLLTESLRQHQVASRLRDVRGTLTDTAAECARTRRTATRVFRKLDASPELTAVARYVNYVDHQIHVLSKQIDATSRLQEKNARALRSLTGELQQDVRQARMVPVESVLDGFRKMVRDLAKDAGKAAELHGSGWHAEADRVVLQALKDPIMHMLRNAVSHGIESPAERAAQGKPPAGRIDLAVRVHGNQLTIAVEDDGRGVDVARVAEIATRKGLLSQSDLAARSPDDVRRLVLLPGFSTSRAVTELSGRGMGLSVVAQAAARLQGTVDVTPGTRGGTRVSISAPLSVSSHRLLLVSCQAQTFAMPLLGIERLCRVKVADVRTVEGHPVITIDGQAIAVVSLAHLLRAAEARVSAAENVLSVMVMRTATRRLAVAVDAFLSEREAIIKDLPAPANGSARMAGAILLEDGSVCLVLNPAEIVEGFELSSDALTLAAAAEAPIGRPASGTILVVDDSLTTRTLEKSVLEAHGYDVAVAVDGMDALKYLRVERPGLVITDLQMPRLDGFGLIEEMKRDPRLAAIPVIIVSSVENPEEQARGMTLGADAYIVKRKFDQRELLDAIRQML